MRGLSLFFLLITIAVWGQEVSVGGDALYWKPMHCTSNFGFQRRTVAGVSTQDDVFAYKTGYDWGARAFLGVKAKCYEAQVSYLWYESITRGEKRSGLLDLFPTTAPIASSGIRGLFIIDYQNVDLRLSKLVGCSPCHRVLLSVSGRWLELTRYQRSQNFAPLDAVNFGQDISREAFRGGGFGVGARIDLSLWCIEAHAEVHPLIAIGKRKDNVNVISGATHIQRNLEKSLAVVPGFEGRVGIAYSKSYCGMLIAARLGYELSYYWDLLPQELISSFNPRPALTCDSIGFAGPSVGITVSY